jgi:suppressor of G2 allele of SKP1
MLVRGYLLPLPQVECWPLRQLEPVLDDSSLEISQTMNHAEKGATSLEANRAEESAAWYTKALIEHPNSPDYYVQRSTAFTRMSPPRHDLALRDAEYAVILGYRRSKRASIQAAQHRRVVALINLGRYGDAKHILDTMVKHLAAENKKDKMQIDMWTAKVNKKMEAATDEQKTVTVEEKIPDQLPSESQRVKNLKKQITSDDTYNFNWEDETTSKSTTADTAPLESTEQSTLTTPNPSATSSASVPTKIRHEWYQDVQSVTVTLYAKGVSKDKAEFDIHEDSVGIQPFVTLKGY